MPDSHRFDNLPDSVREILPLILMLFGIAIPVGLVIAAAAGEEAIVLVLAVVAMVAVGAATMMFMGWITADPDDHGDHEGREGSDEPHH